MLFPEVIEENGEPIKNWKPDNLEGLYKMSEALKDPEGGFAGFSNFTAR